MSVKSDLNFKKKTELIEIILRKDNVEKELKEKLEVAEHNVQKLTDSQKQSNLKLGKVNDELTSVKEKYENTRKTVTEKEDIIFRLENKNKTNIIVIIAIAAIAIIGWVL